MYSSLTNTQNTRKQRDGSGQNVSVRADCKQTHTTRDKQVRKQEILLRATLVHTWAISLDHLGYRNHPLNAIKRPRDQLELASSRYNTRSFQTQSIIQICLTNELGAGFIVVLNSHSNP